MLATPHLVNTKGNIVNVSSVNGMRSVSKYVCVRGGGRGGGGGGGWMCVCAMAYTCLFAWSCLSLCVCLCLCAHVHTHTHTFLCVLKAACVFVSSLIFSEYATSYSHSSSDVYFSLSYFLYSLCLHACKCWGFTFASTEVLTFHPEEDLFSGKILEQLVNTMVLDGSANFYWPCSADNIL